MAFFSYHGSHPFFTFNIVPDKCHSKLFFFLICNFFFPNKIVARAFSFSSFNNTDEECPSFFVFVSLVTFFFFLGFYLFFFFKFYLTLQYCIRFAIYQNESATGIHVFPILNLPPSPYHPSGSSQCTSPKHPVLCIKPGLVTHFIYDIIRVSMPFSQIIPPSPSPTESKRLFYTSVSLLLSRIQGCRYHLSKFHII